MNGSDDDFERLFRSSYAELVRFAARRGELERAEDVAAEAFPTSGRGQGAGSSSHTATEGDPDADALTVEIYSTSSYVPGDPRPGEAEDAHSVLAGLVGPDVSSVVVNTPQHGPVQASVVDGHVAAWWPWELTPPEPAYPDLTFDIELDDGTVRTGIPLAEVDARPEDIRD